MNKLLNEGIELGIFFDEFEEVKDNASLSLDDLLYLRNFKNRELWISGEITEVTAADFLTEVREINRQDHAIPIKQRVPIKVFIDSPGGDVIAGLSIIDVMKASKTPIWTINMSKAYSMAFQVMIAGDKRFAFKNSSFLLHDGAEGGYDSSSKFRDRLKFNDSLDELTKNNIVECTKITKREYEMNIRREWYMLTQEAKELGVIDVIVESLDDVCTFDK